MIIKDYMNALYNETDPCREHYTKTCDCLKWGNDEQEVRKIAIAMFATPEVIRQAADWGANLLIVHEPVFQDHWDNPEELDKKTGIQAQVIKAKRKLIENCGVAVYRFHDHPHYCVPDMISEGETAYWGLKGRWYKGDRYAVNGFELETPMTAEEIRRIISEKLNLKFTRIAGDPSTVCKKIGLCFGTPGGIVEEIEKNDLVVTGELCEWATGELIRDYVQLTNCKKAIIVMGHIGSERDGMRLLAEKLAEKHPDLPVQYFECGEVYC